MWLPYPFQGPIKMKLKLGLLASLHHKNNNLVNTPPFFCQIKIVLTGGGLRKYFFKINSLIHNNYFLSFGSKIFFHLLGLPLT